MDVIGTSAAYDRYGGYGPHPEVGDLSALGLGTYGTAVVAIEFCVHLRSSRPAVTSLTALREQFDQRLLSMPSVTFRRSRKRIAIDFVSERFKAESPEIRTPAPDTHAAAAIELDEALALVRKRIKKTDDFDIDRFESDVAAILRTVDEVSDWKAVGEATRARREAEVAADPWSALDLDWSEFHADARTILDEPFFWTRDDDLAPNGNDTGHDLLDEFRRWNRLRPEASPLVFLDELMRSWEIATIDWTTADTAVVDVFLDSDPVAFSVCTEAAVALAFATIKLRGSCPADVARVGLIAIDRDRRAYPPDGVRKSAQDKLQAKLLQFV